MDMGENDSNEPIGIPAKLRAEVMVKIEVADNLFYPFVYTTRLNEMNVFKINMRNKKAKNIFERVARESKPEYSPTRKMRSVDSGISYEKLTEKIHAINAKQARKTEKILAITAKEARQAKKLKARYQKLPRYEHITVGIGNERDELYSEDTDSYKSAIEDNLKDMDFEDVLINSNPLCKPYGLLIYDYQQNEVDQYYFDEKHCITEHIKYKIDNPYDRITPSVTNNSPIETAYSCCWFERERLLNVFTFPQETVRFLRKPHRCRRNLCSCCCKKNKTVSIPYHNSFDLDKLSPSTWFRSLTVQKSAISNNLLAKCLSLPPIALKPQSRNHIKKHKNFLNPINVQFVNECYEIGLDGQMELLLKYIKDSEINIINLLTKMSKISTVNICCWHKREQYACILFKDGVPNNTINFIRKSHSCPVNNCSCCCKPINRAKSILTLLPISARHSNDMAYNKSNVNSKSSPFSIEKFATHQFNHSFYLPLEKYITGLESAGLEDLQKLNDPQAVKKMLSTFSKVKFTIKGTLIRNTVVADVNLLTMSKTELSILKITLSMIKSSLLHKKRRFAILEKKKMGSNRDKPLPMETVIKKKKTDSSLLSQLSHIADIKNKHFIPSFRGYTSINFPELEINHKVFKPVPDAL